MEITLTPIATVVGGRSQVADDYWGGIQSIIRLNADLPLDTLKGLEEFSHLQVVWHFHHGSEDDVHLGSRHPRGNTDWPETGTFVHRNHRRPARLAISHPRLLKVEGRDLYVEDLDAVDGTPILDIAPWFAEFGPRGEVRQPAWPGQMLSDYWATPPR
ncbi:SAM-dependent methyltransferase [Nocardiopsis sp. EMB25]|uniref:SAM-dependent methyltransferase n=1 Tax=Nocardiopsis sp. EMB25 TaxID=2835867 RepID=UPI002285051C|nr:SAM-dependent methyltransferase [Nocardiopsis sp. EMB25]MCY9785232.1 SAM-dependent methyltransferase [Nocardiopsis sp. EMB25]